MAFVLTKEDGSRLTLEDGTSGILLEGQGSPEPAPTDRLYGVLEPQDRLYGQLVS